jgi:hypothetical protein
MLVLALALLVGQPQTLNVCIGFSSSFCSYTYATHDQALAEAPDNSILYGPLLPDAISPTLEFWTATTNGSGNDSGS